MPNREEADPVSQREYRALLRSATSSVREKYQTECELVIRLAGDLGLRPGEIAHLKQGWVDFDDNILGIPDFEECQKADDGGPCGYCRTRAETQAETNNLSFGAAIRRWWQPKNESSVQDLYFGWNTRLVEDLDQYLFHNSEYKPSRASINRRIDTAAKNSEMLDKSDVNPKFLKSRAAQYHAESGLGPFHLKKNDGLERCYCS